MSDKPTNKPDPGERRVALTARLTLAAYSAIIELQRRHRAQTGSALPMWQVIDAAIKAYAQQEGIQIGEEARQQRIHDH